jgi:hypothetical protein
MKLGVMFSAERKKKPGDVVIPAKMIPFQLLGVPTETRLRTLGTGNALACAFHTVPPESERYNA